jgi:hypothetical protein
MAVSNLTIGNVENTQTIQYFNYPIGQGSGYAPDNTVPLIAGKPTVLRVNIDARENDPNAAVPVTADGTLWVINQVTGESALYNSVNGPIATRQAELIDRTQWNHTLNFIIPWEICTGQLLCELYIFDPADTNSANRNIIFPTLNFIAVPAIKVNSVLIHYTGLDYFNNPVDKQPNGYDVLAVCSYLLRTSAVSTINFDGCTVFQWSLQTSVAANFYLLFDYIGELRALSGTNDLYFGILPPEAGCGGVCGLGAVGGGFCLFFGGADNLENYDAIHEIGHALGRIHAPECLPASDPGDASYPQYSNFPRASIGECGVDTLTMQVFDPRITRDYMSYCSPTWASPYGFNLELASIQSGAFSDRGTGALLNPSVDLSMVGDFHYVRFRVHRPDPNPRVTIECTFHIVRNLPLPAGGRENGISIELTDNHDNLLYSAKCYSSMHDDDPLPFEDFTSYFPDFKNLAAIKIIQEDKVLQRFPVADKAPTIAKMAIEHTKNITRLTWEGKADKKSTTPMSYSVRYSNDGENWKPLAVNLTESKLVVNTDLLPGGKNCRFQVLASAGFRTSLLEIKPFAKALSPRKIHINSPKSNQVFEYGQPIAFCGTAFSPDYGNSVSDEIVWTSLTGGKIGIGHQHTCNNLKVGHHWITIHVPDGEGKMLTESFGIRVIPKKSGGSNPPAIPFRGPGKKPCGCGH